MRFHHLHLPGPITYSHSLRLQEALLEKHFAYKTILRSSSSTNPPKAPNPTLITFQTRPTYTVGRRHLNSNPLSPAQISFLTGSSTSTTQRTDSKNEPSLADFYPSPRGGLLTYHAPGQLTAYLVLNLRTHSLTPRCYIRLVEHSVIRTIARYGVTGGVTGDPGVWILRPQNNNENVKNSSVRTLEEPDMCETERKLSNTNEAAQGTTSETKWVPTDRKICAIGVQVSRGITSHGIGLNLFDSPIVSTPGLPRRELYTFPNAEDAAATNDTETFARLSEQLSSYRSTESVPEPDPESTVQHEALAPGYLSWGFSRIVACGLEGKSVTWVTREQNTEDLTTRTGGEQKLLDPFIDHVADSLAIEMCRSLELDENDITRISEQEVLE